MELQPPSQLNKWTFRRVVWSTLVVALVALGFWLLYRFYQVIFILFIAIVIGTVVRPAAAWLQRRGLSRIAGVVLAYVLIFAFLIGFMLLLFPLVIKQGTTIAGALPDYYQSLRVWMVINSNPLIQRFSQFLPAVLPGLASTPQTGQQVLDSAGQALGYVSMGANAIFMAIAIILLAFHWTLEGPRTIQSFVLLIPKGQRTSIYELISAMETKVSSFIAGQGILCLAIGIMALVVYLLIGLPNALVLALVAGVLEAVPMLGPLLGAVPAGLVALSIGPDKLIWVVVGTLVIQQLEGSFLVPRVMSKTVGVNPFVSLLAIFAFGSFLGLGGVLMAIPLAAIIQLLLDRFVFHPETLMESEVSAGRDHASRLRYEAQDLARDLQKQARHRKHGTDQWVKQTDQVMDEIEAITTDLDALLSQVHTPGTP